MAREFPSSVDVAIVGSGPNGAAYARILSELRPDLRVATFEVGPLISDPPGAHVKGIGEDEARGRAQRRSEGTDDAGRRRPPPPGRHVPARGRVPPGGRGRHPLRGDVEQRRRHGVALDVRLPPAW